MMAPMTVITEVPTEQFLAGARQARLSRVLLTVLGAVGVAAGWGIGRFFTSIGWLAGRTFLIGAYFTEAVIFGFRAGAKLPPKQPEPLPSR